MAPKRKTPKEESKALTIAAAITAGIGVASLAFISLEAALLAAGFFGAISFVMSDVKRRRFWENGLTFRMKGLSDSVTVMGHKLTGTRQDVLNIRQEIAAINRRVSAQVERIDEIQMSQPVQPTRPAATKTAQVDDFVAPTLPKPRSRFAPPPASPAAVRPGQKTAPAPAANKNDSEYDDLSDMVVQELVTHAVRSRAIDVFVQPIVRLPQRKVRFYEMYARVRARPGMYLPARRYMKLARANSLVNEIDNILLMECLKTIEGSAHIERAAPLFLNITDITLKNTTFMKRLVNFLATNRHLAPRLVFEMPQSGFRTLEDAPREILRGLGRLGCSVSIDHVEKLDFDVLELQKLHVRFIKVSAKTLLPYTNNEKSRAELQRQKRKLESSGISFIIEKIETEHDLLELLDFEITYGQGHLFGRPDLEAAYRKRRAA